MSRRSRAIDEARHQAQMQGGEVEDYLDEEHRSNGRGKWKGPYASGESTDGKVIAEYVYLDERGNNYLRVERKLSNNGERSMPQAHWVNGKWKYGAPKGAKIPYNLPDLVAAPPDTPVFICEGEKDANNLTDLGLLATCNSGGAGKWTADHGKWFVGKKTAYVLEDNDEAGRRHAKKVAHALARNVNEVRIVALPNLMEKGDVSDWLAAGGTKEKLLELCAAAPLHKAELLDAADPMRSARALAAAEYTDGDGLRTVYRHRGAFWLWARGCYQLADDETMRAAAWTFLERSWRHDEKGPVPFKPNRYRVGDVEAALGAMVQLDKYTDPPAWLVEGGNPPAAELLSCDNGLLHLPTGKLYPATPALFNLSASEAVFDDNAGRPVLWCGFLNELFGDDTEAIETLQEWFGYVLAPDTSQQKILLLVGPKRSGKGTIARILTKLLGRNSVAGPTMSSLSENFGLEPLITKPLAIVSDARIGARTDKSAVVERLLSISGEDHMTVARKFKDAWHGRLFTRFMILTNELPSLSDGSGALSGRFIVLLLKNSFFGKEDPALINKLSMELPGILNWSIKGYRRLRERGHFVQPKSAQEAVDDIEMLAAPVKAFIRDCCNLGPGLTTTADELWSTWQHWSAEEGRRDAGTKQWFGRNLRSAEPGISVSKLRSGDHRELAYVGIDIKPEVRAAAIRQPPM